MNRDYHLSIRMDRDTHDKIEYVAAYLVGWMCSVLVFVLGG